MADEITVRVVRAQFRYDRDQYAEGDILSVEARTLDRHPRSLERVEPDDAEADADTDTESDDQGPDDKADVDAETGTEAAAEETEVCGYYDEDEMDSPCGRDAGWGRDADEGPCKDHVDDA